MTQQSININCPISPLPHDDEYYRNLDQTSREWEEARKHFTCTGSGLATLCGLSAYKDKRSDMVKHKKNGTEKKFSKWFIENPLKWGRDHEKDGREILMEYFTEIGLEGKFVFGECGIQPAKTKNGVHIGASPDLILRDTVTSEVKHVVEIKCPWSRNFGRYNGVENVIDYLTSPSNVYHITPKTDETYNLRLPAEYFIQLQMQLFTTKSKSGYFVGWTPNCSFVLEIPFHQQLWDDHLEPRCEELYLEVKGSMTGASDKQAKESGKIIERKIHELQDKYNKFVYMRIQEYTPSE